MPGRNPALLGVLIILTGLFVAGILFFDHLNEFATPSEIREIPPGDAALDDETSVIVRIGGADPPVSPKDLLELPGGTKIPWSDLEVNGPTASDIRKSDADGILLHEVREGETLTGLAKRYLGSIQKVGDIRDVNPDLLDPDRLRQGQKIRIPLRRAR